MMKAIRILLVDDNPDILQAIAKFLARHAPLEVVGRAASGREALAVMSYLQPDLVVVDLQLPDLDGLEVTRRLKQLPAAPRIIITTLIPETDYHHAVQAAGADGLVGKVNLAAELLPLINQLFQ